MVEGFLEITGITYPESAIEGDLVEFTIHTQNIGADDNFKIELIGDLTDVIEVSLGAGLTYDPTFQFTMPNHNVNITVNAYHLEVPTGFVKFRTTDLSYGSGSAIAFTDTCGNTLIACGIESSGADQDDTCETRYDAPPIMENLPGSLGSDGDGNIKLFADPTDSDEFWVCENRVSYSKVCYIRRYDTKDSDASKVSTSPTTENSDYEISC